MTPRERQLLDLLSRVLLMLEDEEVSVQEEHEDLINEIRDTLEDEGKAP
jgi:hypothetical protein